MNDSEESGQASSVPSWFHNSPRTLGPSMDVDETREAFDRDRGIDLILVLNLDRQADRWTLFQSGAMRHRLRDGGTLIERCERVSAVDGLAAPIGAYLPSEIEGTYSRGLLLGRSSADSRQI